jgi:hypothetical protein
MKFMTLGGTYTSNIWITYLGDKIDGPVDNTMAENGLSDMLKLFNGEFQKAMNEQKFEVKKEKFLLLLNIGGFWYRPETFSNLLFFFKLFERYKNFENSLKEKNLFYAYSTSKSDEEKTEEELIEFKNNLPDILKERLFIITETEDSVFNKVFPTFYLKNQKEVDIYDDERPLIMKDWDKFVEEQTEKGFFPKEEKKTLEEILED